MRRISVVIPSRNIENLNACTGRVRTFDPGLRIIAVDDGLSEAVQCAFVVPGVKPFIFARNVNIGIRAAGDDDIIILNDDALLHHDPQDGGPGGFTILQRAAEEHPEYGLIASTCNNVGNPNQQRRPDWHPHGFGLREDPRMVCFVCVFIPRRTIDAVGLLDERFVGYGMDDDDYCLRVRNAGLKIGIHDGCYVDHGSLKSSYRGAAGAGGDFQPNLKLFIEKWGVDNWGRPA